MYKFDMCFFDRLEVCKVCYTQSAINSALSAVGNAELSFADTSLAASAQISAASDEDKEQLLKVSGNF